MLSPAQQRGRLRQLIIRELKTADLKGYFKSLLRENEQDVTGFLQRSISSSRYETSVTVRSSVNSQSGWIEDIQIFLGTGPWGRYGNELDSKFGVGAVKDPPNTETIMQWINAKGVTAILSVDKTLKSGEKKQYTYVNTLSAKKAMAYHIAKRIRDTRSIKTRYDYTSSIEEVFSSIVYQSLFYWFEEMGVEFLGRIETEITGLV
jgi:hypothetical protein